MAEGSEQAARDGALTHEELESIGERAIKVAEAADDPGVRAAFQLLSEAARNAARKLPHRA